MSDDAAGRPDVINVCFHGIGAPQRQLEPGEDRYWVTEDDFRRILDEVAAWPSVRLSFDDGNLSDVAHGLPELVQRGLSATFFVLGGRLGAAGSLDGSDLRQLRAHGMAIGSHGMHHRPWRALSDQHRDAELVAAREQIGEAAGVPVVEAACPLGRYDRQLLSDLRRLGYARVHTSDRRPASPGSWLQPRFSVRAGDTAASLRAEVLHQPRPARYRAAAAGLLKQWR